MWSSPGRTRSRRARPRLPPAAPPGTSADTHGPSRRPANDPDTHRDRRCLQGALGCDAERILGTDRLHHHRQRVLRRPRCRRPIASQYVDPRRPANVAWEPDCRRDGLRRCPTVGRTRRTMATRSRSRLSADIRPPVGRWARRRLARRDDVRRSRGEPPVPRIALASVDPSVGASIDDLSLTYVKGLPSLTTSDAQDITVGGRAARGLYVEVARSWTAACPDLPGTPATGLPHTSRRPDDGWTFGVRSTERALLVFVDIGQRQHRGVHRASSTYRVAIRNARDSRRCPSSKVVRRSE